MASAPSAKAAQRFPAQQLHQFCVRVFTKLNVPPEDAAQAADVLLASDLRGIDSHGVARLHSYHGMLSAGRINARCRPRVVRERAATATVDGDNGLGLVVGPWANRVAMTKAEATGSGWVSVCNTNHYGIAGYYVLEALKRDLIGWSMTNSTALVTPLWGAARMLGTNPIAIGFPANKEPPVIVDFATSACAYGKVEIAKRTQVSMPAGWAVDANGVLTTEPQQMIDGGALLPLGSQYATGGHKGYCLAAAVDILTCVLSGANWGPFAPPFMLRQQIPTRAVGKGIGHFFGALRLDGFIEPNEFKNQIDEWRRVMTSTRKAPDAPSAPIIPGDPERLAEEDRKVHGIPLLESVVNDLREIARNLGLSL